MGFLSSVTGGAVKDEALNSINPMRIGTYLQKSAEYTGKYYNPFVAMAQAGGEHFKEDMDLFGLIKKEGGPSKEEMSPEERAYTELRQKQMNEALDFKRNIPTYQNELGEAVDKDIRSKLYGDLAENQVSANRRGLLGSGIQHGQQAGLYVGAGAESAQKRAQLNKELQDRSKAYDEAVTTAGRSAYAGKVEDADRAYKEALARSQNQQGMLNGLLGGAGAIGGAYLGSQK